MDEHVLVAAVRLDKPITLGRVEPFDGTLGHRLSPALAHDPEKCSRFPRRSCANINVKKTQTRSQRVPRHKRSPGLLNFPNSRETHSRTADPIAQIAT